MDNEELIKELNDKPNIYILSDEEKEEMENVRQIYKFLKAAGLKIIKE